MTPQQISLVTASWQKVMPISDTAAELFYGKLFEMDPALKPLFKGDMKAQGKKLMTMNTTAVIVVSAMPRSEMGLRIKRTSWAIAPLFLQRREVRDQRVEIFLRQRLVLRGH